MTMIRPTSPRSLAGSVAALALLTCGFIVGRGTSLETLSAQNKSGVVQASATDANPAAADKRVVAYINNTTPLSREDFGEYLIQRHGAQSIDLFVNRKIIEAAAKKAGHEVTDLEVTATINEDCKAMGLTMQQFNDQVLKHQGKTMFEWREDSIRHA